MTIKISNKAQSRLRRMAAACLTLLVLPSLAHAELVFDYTAFLNLLRENNVKTIEQMVAVLPQSYKDNYVLMYQSGSLQYGSEKFPRVIAFGDSNIFETSTPGQNPDRLYIAFQSTSDPNTSPQSSPQSVEIIEWLPNNRGYVAHNLLFGPSGFHEESTNVCSNCHTSDLRTNWTAYPQWHGALKSGRLDAATPGWREKQKSHFQT